MLADRAPPADQTVWLSLQTAALGMESLEMHVVATSADPSGKHLVRVRFTSWVPLDAILEKHRERRLLATVSRTRDLREPCSGTIRTSSVRSRVNC